MNLCQKRPHEFPTFVYVLLVAQFAHCNTLVRCQKSEMHPTGLFRSLFVYEFWRIVCRRRHGTLVLLFDKNTPEVASGGNLPTHGDQLNKQKCASIWTDEIHNLLVVEWLYTVGRLCVDVNLFFVHDLTVVWWWSSLALELRQLSSSTRHFSRDERVFKLRARSSYHWYI